MKTNIESLVEEALNKLREAPADGYVWNRKQILTTLAEKASQNGLQPLPEEVPEWFMIGYTEVESKNHWNGIVQHFGTKPREWWMGLKKGDKFMDCNGIVRLYNGFVFLGTDRSGTHEVRLCSPYTEPTTLEQFMATLTPEQWELAKSLKIEEGGK